MLKITVIERPYFGHGTKAKHVYETSESLSKITYDRFKGKLVVEFDSCSDALELHIDELRWIEIERS